VRSALEAVGEAVVVAVRVEDVDEPVEVGVLSGVRLAVVDQTVVVRVRIVRTRTDEDFEVVRERVIVRVGLKRETGGLQTRGSPMYRGTSRARHVVGSASWRQNMDRQPVQRRGAVTSQTRRRPSSKSITGATTSR
jgi:hypothetical protein